MPRPPSTSPDPDPDRSRAILLLGVWVLHAQPLPEQVEVIDVLSDLGWVVVGGATRAQDGCKVAIWLTPADRDTGGARTACAVPLSVHRADYPWTLARALRAVWRWELDHPPE